MGDRHAGDFRELRGGDRFGEVFFDELDRCRKILKLRGSLVGCFDRVANSGDADDFPRRCSNRRFAGSEPSRASVLINDEPRLVGQRLTRFHDFLILSHVGLRERRGMKVEVGAAENLISGLQLFHREHG